MGFREDNVVVIEVGSFTTRAVVGLAESMTPPQVRVQTKVGVKRKQNEDESPQYLFGEELEAAISAKDPELEVINPIVRGVIVDWDAIEIFW
jgi:actin-related protein 9